METVTSYDPLHAITHIINPHTGHASTHQLSHSCTDTDSCMFHMLTLTYVPTHIHQLSHSCTCTTTQQLSLTHEHINLYIHTSSYTHTNLNAFLDLHTLRLTCCGHVLSIGHKDFEQPPFPVRTLWSQVYTHNQPAPAELSACQANIQKG